MCGSTAASGKTSVLHIDPCSGFHLCRGGQRNTAEPSLRCSRNGGSTRRSRTLLAEVQRGSPRNHIQAVQKGDTGTKAHSLVRTRKSMQKKANGERKYAPRAPWVFHRPCRAFLGLCGLPSVSLGLVGCETAAHVARQDYGFWR